MHVMNLWPGHVQKIVLFLFTSETIFQILQLLSHEAMTMYVTYFQEKKETTLGEGITNLLTNAISCEPG